MRTKLAAIIGFIILFLGLSCSVNEPKKISKTSASSSTTSASGTSSSSTTSTSSSTSNGTGGESGQGGDAGQASTGGSAGSGGDAGSGGQSGAEYCPKPGYSEFCITSCDTNGSRTCSYYHVWSGCFPPPEVCNGEDDDCDNETDEDDICGSTDPCVSNGGACVPGAYGCSGLDSFCYYDPDGPAGKPEEEYKCDCYDPSNPDGFGTWAPYDAVNKVAVCSMVELCWQYDPDSLGTWAPWNAVTKEAIRSMVELSWQ